MDEQNRENEVVFKSRDRRECMELRLVLDAAGIQSHAIARGEWWVLAVDPNDWSTAAYELNAYAQENVSRSTNAVVSVPVYGGAAVGISVYSAVLILIGVISLPRAMGIDLYSAGGSQAGMVVAGQLWRTVTALTLHVDAGHLVSNLLFGCLFGFLAGRSLGGGIAWASIVVAGALGNLLNAWIQAPEHRSVGASTGVFAALGIMVAHALRPKSKSGENALRRWSPLVGGVMLLALIGVGGERTDVMAHVTGFFAGLILGWAISRIPSGYLASAKIQFSAGAFAVAFVAIAWVLALSV